MRSIRTQCTWCILKVNDGVCLRLLGIQNSTIAQASGEKRKKVQLTWEAPNNSNYGDIYFR